MYINGKFEEISDSMILQMMGRAGRQQYSSTGCVHVMTKADRVVSKKEKKNNLFRLRKLRSTFY